MIDRLHTLFGRARLDDRQINELIGMSHGLLADGKIDQTEAEYLQAWLVANSGANDNPIICNLLIRLNDMLSDGVLDKDEAQELFDTLHSYSGGGVELGELLKSSTLPIDNPPPTLSFVGTRFCFTGTFAYGSRRECEAAVKSLGAAPGSLTQQTDYLVIGIYATDSWAHSSYGRKIEKALDMREKGITISIIGEEHWQSNLPL